MAASLKAPKKMRLDYNIDKDTYVEFVKACSRKGYTPHVVVERIIKRFLETGQM